MTFIECFDDIKARLEKKNLEKCDCDFAIQITMTDEDCGGVFYVTHLDGAFAVEPYDYHDHTAHIITDSKTLVKVINGKAETLDQYLGNALWIEGNPDHVRALASLKRKCASAKPAAKAAEAKPAAKKCAKKPAGKTTAKKAAKK